MEKEIDGGKNKDHANPGLAPADVVEGKNQGQDRRDGGRLEEKIAQKKEGPARQQLLRSPRLPG